MNSGGHRPAVAVDMYINGEGYDLNGIMHIEALSPWRELKTWHQSVCKITCDVEKKRLREMYSCGHGGNRRLTSKKENK